MLGFEWDPAKAAANLAKHGVSFDEAAMAFGDPMSVVIADPDHSAEEDRWLLLGATFRGRRAAVHPAAQPAVASGGRS